MHAVVDRPSDRRPCITPPAIHPALIPHLSFYYISSMHTSSFFSLTLVLCSFLSLYGVLGFGGHLTYSVLSLPIYSDLILSLTLTLFFTTSPLLIGTPPLRQPRSTAHKQAICIPIPPPPLSSCAAFCFGLFFGPASVQIVHSLGSVHIYPAAVMDMYNHHIFFKKDRFTSSFYACV